MQNCVSKFPKNTYLNHVLLRLSCNICDIPSSSSFKILSHSQSVDVKEQKHFFPRFHTTATSRLTNPIPYSSIYQFPRLLFPRKFGRKLPRFIFIPGGPPLPLDGRRKYGESLRIPPLPPRIGELKFIF